MVKGNHVNPPLQCSRLKQQALAVTDNLVSGRQLRHGQTGAYE
jgi:hypothetical protein